MSTLKARAHAAFARRRDNDRLMKVDDVLDVAVGAVAAFTAAYEDGELPTFETKPLHICADPAMFARAFVCRDNRNKALGEKEAYMITLMYRGSAVFPTHFGRIAKKISLDAIKEMGWHDATIVTGCLPRTVFQNHYVRVRVAMGADVVEEEYVGGGNVLTHPSLASAASKNLWSCNSHASPWRRTTP